MNKIDSIVKQYNKSGRKDSLLKDLQTNFINEGTHVVSFDDKDFIIQKCPELLYKVIDLVTLQRELDFVLSDSAGVLIKLTINKLLEDELVQTNNIEQIHTDRQSVHEIINGNIPKQKSRETQMTKHYIKILNEELEFDTPEQVSKLYYNFLQDYISQDDLNSMGNLFRNESVNVVTAKNKVIHTGVKGEENIHAAIESILTYLNNDNEHIFIKIAAFHYFFGYIHPFYDGNGRMVRLMTSAKLFPELSIASLAISDVIMENQSIYYQMFDETNSSFNVSDITSFVYKFLEFIEDATQKTIFHLKENNHKIMKFNEFISALDLNEKAKECLSIIYQASLVGEILSQKQLANDLQVSISTLRKNLSTLHTQGYIHIDKSIKPNIHSINTEWLDNNFVYHAIED